MVLNLMKMSKLRILDAKSDYCGKQSVTSIKYDDNKNISWLNMSFDNGRLVFYRTNICVYDSLRAYIGLCGSDKSKQEIQEFLLETEIKSFYGIELCNNSVDFRRMLVWKKEKNDYLKLLQFIFVLSLAYRDLREELISDGIGAYIEEITSVGHYFQNIKRYNIIDISLENDVLNDDDIEQYNSNLSDVAYLMYDGVTIAEKCGTLLYSVWNNVLMRIHNAETDKYTLHDGMFYDNVTEAISALFNDENFDKEIKLIKDNLYQVKKLMKEYIEPPDECCDAYEALECYYNAYKCLTNLILNVNGSLNSYTNNFNYFIAELNRCYENTEYYFG